MIRCPSRPQPQPRLDKRMAVANISVNLRIKNPTPIKSRLYGHYFSYSASFWTSSLISSMTGYRGLPDCFHVQMSAVRRVGVSQCAFGAPEFDQALSNLDRFFPNLVVPL